MYTWPNIWVRQVITQWSLGFCFFQKGVGVYRSAHNQVIANVISKLTACKRSQWCSSHISLRGLLSCWYDNHTHWFHSFSSPSFIQPDTALVFADFLLEGEFLQVKNSCQWAPDQCESLKDAGRSGNRIRWHSLKLLVLNLELQLNFRQKKTHYDQNFILIPNKWQEEDFSISCFGTKKSWARGWQL